MTIRLSLSERAKWFIVSWVLGVNLENLCSWLPKPQSPACVQAENLIWKNEAAANPWPIVQSVWLLPGQKTTQRYSNSTETTQWSHQIVPAEGPHFQEMQTPCQQSPAIQNRTNAVYKCTRDVYMCSQGKLTWSIIYPYIGHPWIGSLRFQSSTMAK